MMLLFLLIVPLIFNIGGLIDTYLTHKVNAGTIHGTSVLMLFGGFIALFFAGGIRMVFGPTIFNLSFISSLLLLGSGFVFGWAVFPYLEALKTEKIENIIPIFQTVPLFTYTIAHLILGESLSIIHIVIMIAIVVVTGLFTLDGTTGKLRRNTLGLMFFSTGLYSLLYVLFKRGGGESVLL